MLDRLSGGMPSNSNAIRLPRDMPTSWFTMIVIVPKRNIVCVSTATTTKRLKTPPSARGSYSTRCRALHRRFSFHAPNRQGRPSGLKHQEGLAGDPAVGAGLVSPPSDCIRRSVLPLCRLRPDVSGPPPLTPWVSAVVRQTPLGERNRGEGFFLFLFFPSSRSLVPKVWFLSRNLYQGGA